MRRPGRRDQALGRMLAVALAALFVLLAVQTASAQQRISGTAELRRVTGRVEVLRKGQTQWAPAVVGARLQAGDDMRAYGASSAELLMADGSTLLLAENSRVFVTKLEVDPQNQTRDALFHVVVGKVKAVVAQAAITLVRARQSNFTISTPTAVAAARGTAFVVIYSEVLNQMILAVLIEDPAKPLSIVSCIALNDRFTTTLVRGGLGTTATSRGCQPPSPITDPDIDTTKNPMALGPAFFGAANPVAPFSLPGFTGEGVLFSSGVDLLSSFPPSSFNRDTFINQTFQSQSGLTNPTNP
jgi:FecR-like protein